MSGEQQRCPGADGRRASFEPQFMQKGIAPAERLPVPVELIERRIYVIRGQKVMLDSDLDA